jgi:CRP-like cAMP-binding protein
MAAPAIAVAWFTDVRGHAACDSLNAIPMLASVRADDRAALDPLCRVRPYARGDTIFREAESADRIHFAVSGRVKIVKAAGVRDRSASGVALTSFACSETWQTN